MVVFIIVKGARFFLDKILNKIKSRPGSKREEKKMRQKITEEELKNPQKFISEGLGAPEPGEEDMNNLEAKAQGSAGRIHC